MTHGILYYYHQGHWKESYFNQSPTQIPIIIDEMIIALANCKKPFYSQFKFKFITTDNQHSPPFDIENIWIAQCWLSDTGLV